MHENNTISNYAKEFTEEIKNSKKKTFMSRLSDMINNNLIVDILTNRKSYYGNLLTDDAISELKNLLPENMFAYEKEYFIQALAQVGRDYILKTYTIDQSENQIEIGNILDDKDQADHLQRSYSMNLNMAWPELKTILSCSDFMRIFDEYELNDKELDKSNDKKCLQTLLDKCKDWSYTDVRKAVNESSLSYEEKQKVFVQVLPKYEFDFYSDFYSTWSVFEDGNIELDDLVTEVWVASKFDLNDDHDCSSSYNAFAVFARHYIQYLNNDENALDNLGAHAKNMINGLRQKGVIANNDIKNLRDQINNATDVGIFGIIAQFFSNLFSKGKTAFKPIQQTKQDRVISNLKPLSGLLRQAAERHRDGSEKLI